MQSRDAGSRGERGRREPAWPGEEHFGSESSPMFLSWEKPKGRPEGTKQRRVVSTRIPARHERFGKQATFS